MGNATVLSGDLFINLIATAVQTWFIWFPVFSVLVFLDLWVPYIRNLSKARVEWGLLDIKITREILKGAKVMEQFFASIHNLRMSPGNLVELYWLGDVSLPFSFELVSLDGEIHFFLRSPKKFKNVLEANLYAYYPDLEISVAEDYTKKVPKTTAELYRNGYDVWGSELILAKEDAYPIRTYMEFETMDDYSKFDPITTLLEILAKLKPGEQAWLQILLVPAEDSWHESGKKLVAELQKKTRVSTVIGGEEVSMVDRTPGQVNVMKAIEANVAKPGFYTLMRVVYVARKDVYSSGYIKGGMLGAFNQFALQTMSSFKHNSKIRTETTWYYSPYFFPSWRLEMRKQSILGQYRRRNMPETSFMGMYRTGGTVAHSNSSVFILNIEELATIFHFPTTLVLTAPIMRRVESKRVGPPAGLPIFGTDESKIPGFE